MRKLSRWMPPKKTYSTFVGWLVVGILDILFWPFAFVAQLLTRRQFRELEGARSGEDIGTFARGFSREKEAFDAWVIRATWDAVTPYVTFDGRIIPIRSTDRLVEDLHIDPDDIDFDLVVEVADRSHHSLVSPELNPYFGRIVTVGDLVRFVTLQPSLAKEVAGQVPA
jgi:hypothetical protein